MGRHKKKSRELCCLKLKGAFDKIHWGQTFNVAVPSIENNGRTHASFELEESCLFESKNVQLC